MATTPSDSGSPLHEQVNARFEAEFGAPYRTFGADSHWRLRPGLGKLTINVLLNGDLRHPALWVFDPHDRENGVVKAAITSMAEAGVMIAQIKHRLERAASNGPGSA